MWAVMESFDDRHEILQQCIESTVALHGGTRLVLPTIIYALKGMNINRVL